MLIYDKGSTAEQRKKNGLLNNGVGETEFPYWKLAGRKERKEREKIGRSEGERKGKKKYKTYTKKNLTSHSAQKWLVSKLNNKKERKNIKVL